MLFLIDVKFCLYSFYPFTWRETYILILENALSNNDWSTPKLF